MARGKLGEEIIAKTQKGGFSRYGVAPPSEEAVGEVRTGIPLS